MAREIILSGELIKNLAHDLHDIFVVQNIRATKEREEEKNENQEQVTQKFIRR